MNKEKILVMEADRYLDNLIAIYVFNNETYEFSESGELWAAAFKLAPHYSSDISAAWEVVGKLDHDGKHLVWHENKKKWCFIFGKGTWGRWSSYGDTAPEAICKAALMAVMDL